MPTDEPTSLHMMDEILFETETNNAHRNTANHFYLILYFIKKARLMALSCLPNNFWTYWPILMKRV
jgi:hypothetical protein